MGTDIKREVKLEIGHVPFIDIVGYSKAVTDRTAGTHQRAQPSRSRLGGVSGSRGCASACKNSGRRWNGTHLELSKNSV
jgi:hypothetical protein